MAVNGRGGTSISKWKPRDTLYNEAVKQTKKALKYGVLKGIMWHQGESDSSKYDTYTPEIITLIKSFRRDFDLPDMLVVVGQLSPDKSSRLNFN